jgi:hypothetical protein
VAKGKELFEAAMPEECRPDVLGEYDAVVLLVDDTQLSGW